MGTKRIICYDTCPGGGGWVGSPVIIGLISVQLQLNLPTGTELGKIETERIKYPITLSSFVLTQL